MGRAKIVAGEKVMSIGSRIGDIITTAPGLGAIARRLCAFLSRKQAQHHVACPAYSDWIQKFDTPSPIDIDRHRDEIAAFRLKPTISILMPVFQPDPAILDAAIRSVYDQLYTRWELCIVADASTSLTVVSVLRGHSNADARIKLRFHDARSNVSAASNTALEMATGNYVALLRQDDLLPLLALHWVVESINRHPDARILYSDEDKIDAHGRRYDPGRDR